MAESNRWNGKTKGALVAVILLAAGFAVAAYGGLFDSVFKKSPTEIAKAAGVVSTGEVLKIPLTALDSGKALFLAAELDGRQFHYFAMRSSDGAYRAAFDACDVCFRANRGYRQEGDLMVCNQCGQAFPGTKINEVKGGCNPVPLARQVMGRYLVIQKADLAAGARYFPSKRS
jgi:uncharacterized membrane protein